MVLFFTVTLLPFTVLSATFNIHSSTDGNLDQNENISIKSTTKSCKKGSHHKLDEENTFIVLGVAFFLLIAFIIILIRCKPFRHKKNHPRLNLLCQPQPKTTVSFIEFPLPLDHNFQPPTPPPSYFADQRHFQNKRVHFNQTDHEIL